MTDAERLEWARGVLNREKWDDRAGWIHYGFCLSAFAAIAIALALDEQARRRLPEHEQAKWAADELTRLGWCDTQWMTQVRDGHWYLWSYDFSSVFGSGMAVAIAENFLRREMLGDTSDANAKGVKP